MENNYDRASAWAHDKLKRGEIEKPAVIGPVLHLGTCCDFLDSNYINLVSKYHQLMVAHYQAMGKPIPENKDTKGDAHKDKLMRELDCAVIEFMHEQIFRSMKSS